MNDVHVKSAARALIEEEMKAKIAAVERLATSQATEDELLARLAALQQSRRQEWSEAQSLGWSPQALRKLKLRRPTENGRAPRRGRAQSESSVRGAAGATSGEPSPDEAASPVVPGGEASAAVPLAQG